MNFISEAANYLIQLLSLSITSMMLKMAHCKHKLWRLFSELETIKTLGAVLLSHGECLKNLVEDSQHLR